MAGLPATVGEPGAYGLGQRVPMLVVSPWSKGGYVTSEVLDHTSIIRFIEQRFGVKEPNISPWRRAVCGDLTSAFDFKAVDGQLPALPSTAAYLPPDHDRHPDVVPVPPTHQSVPKQEAGVRRARPLPYNLDVAATVRHDGITLVLSNRGRAGAVFHTRARQVGSPAGMNAQMFTVESGRQLRTTVAASQSAGYDVEIHGPNGFYRHVAGNASPAAPVVSAAPAGSGESLKLIVTNAGPAVELTITDNRGNRRPRTVHLARGAHVDYVLDDDTDGWYDVTVTSSGDPRFIRRLAGHVETGRPSISDPALAQ